MEVISSSYTLKPVYRRAAANKASDKIAKEAAKNSRTKAGTSDDESEVVSEEADSGQTAMKQPNHRSNSQQRQNGEDLSASAADKPSKPKSRSSSKSNKGM